MPHRPALPTMLPKRLPARLSTLLRPVAVAAVLATGLVPLGGAVGSAASASTDASRVVISEVYGGGGSTSSSWSRDYVELYNPTDQPMDLAGTSVQYRSSSSTANPSGTTALSGTIPARSHFMVGEAKGAVGAAVPEADVEGGIAMSGTSGTVFLAAQPTTLTSPPTGSVTGDAAILDVVGYGATNTFETAAAKATSATTTLSRSDAGTDTDSNAADLTLGAGSPEAAPAGPPPPPPGPAERHPIAEIQGPGATSPLVGRSVVTSGVVTAAYPTGGFNGFYLQTAGTGGQVDPATHPSSEAVFVFGSAVAGAVHVGDHVEVTGTVSEFNGTTELTPAAASDVVPLSEPASVRPTVLALPGTEAGRESFEGMLLAPSGPFTVTDNYALNSYAEIGLATGTTPLYAPTEVVDAQDTAGIARVRAENAARSVVLDDGASANFLTGAGRDVPLPYLTQDEQIRVGAPVHFDEPVVLDWRYDRWRFQPTGQLTAAGTPPATFGHTRTAAPAPVGGNVRIASFNVLNYFPTTGADVVAAGGRCTWYDDRVGDHVTVNSCSTGTGGDGPRGAAEDEDLARQQAKIVHALNGLGADVVSLEEIENSATFGQDRDAAVGTLVEALNADAGAGTWRFVPSPAGAADQTGEDVIRTAFIYKAAAVEPVGPSVIDDVPVFDIARDPLAQAFEPVGAGKYSRFTVIVNHLKSKGSGVDDGTGQGNSNPQRVQQAREVVRFAEQMKTELGTERQYLSGDFNAYTQEDPMQVLYDAGFTDIGSHASPEEHTYLFDGTVGSLDHVLGNAAAMRDVTGAHVWNLSSVESVALEYSRVNYNATDFYQPGPYRSSDHDPLLVGLSLPTGPVATSVAARVSPDPVEFRSDHAVLTATVSSDRGVIDGGTVEVRERGTLIGTATVRDGVARTTLPAYTKKGRHTLTVRYLGTEDAAPSSTRVSFTVVKPPRVGTRGGGDAHS